METLLEQGLELMLIGMGVVFSFLILLVGLTTLMSWVVNRFFPDAAPQPAAAPMLTPAPTATVDSTTLRVIEDAIRQHRARTGRR
jgi:oxaloacetate decarboxylase (Na+ extruding) subunit gamma